MVYTFFTNIFIKNTNLWPEQRRAGHLVEYIILYIKIINAYI